MAGGTATAARVSNVAMRVGDALAVLFDNDQIQNGGQVGLALLNAAGQTLAVFTFAGGQSAYRVDDRAGSRVTWIPWSDQGCDIVIRVAAQRDCHLSCGDYVGPGLFKNVADPVIAAVKFWSGNAGSGSTRDGFVDQLSVIAP